jgi:sialic acid synthase SpsE
VIKNFRDSERCFIVAEAGINHQGKLRLAKELIKAAKTASADAIKFQLYRTENLVSKFAPKIPYHNKLISQYELLKEYELDFSEFEELFDYAKKQDIELFFSVFDEESLDFVVDLGVNLIKISSGEVTNIPFIEKISQKRLPIIISTGACTLDELTQAVNTIKKYTQDIILLHCVTNYPTKASSVNLKMIESLKRLFNLPVGFSDHTSGIEIAQAARVLGAQLIEKHFILDKRQNTPDKQVSITPKELKRLVINIRMIEEALGDGIKKMNEIELKLRHSTQKVIVATKDINKNSIIKDTDLTFKRAGKGILPKDINLLIGKIAKRKIKKDEPIQWIDIYE